MVTFFAYRATRGQAAVEYAIIVALVGLVACGLAFVASTQMQGATAGLAQDLRGPGSAREPGAAGATAAPVIAGELPPEPAPTARATRDRAAGAAALLVVGGALGTILWRRFRKRQRARALHSDPAAAPPEVQSERIDAWIFAKRQNLLRALVADSDLLTKGCMTVRHVMTRTPVVVSLQTDVEKLNALMAEYGIHHLLVCQSPKRLAGVISDRDLRGRPGTTAAEIMTAEVITVTPDTPLSTAITCLIEGRFSCLPVVDGKRLCGLITSKDFMLVAQCALQLWLRFAHMINEDPSWKKELARVAAAVNAELSRQQTRVKELADAIGWVAVCSKDKACRRVSTAADEVLAATARLASLVAEGQKNLEERARRNAELLDSGTDAVTGLSNRRGLDQILTTAQALKKRYQQPFSLIVLTVAPAPPPTDGNCDGLDALVLQAVAQSVIEEVRDTDVAARHRPDGFALVLPHTELEQTPAVCARLQRALAATLQDLGQFTVRLGVASAVADEEPAALLARAEEALAGPGSAADRHTLLEDEHGPQPADQVAATAG
jgi:diguanylate cyclase (GGDEF)-like protein